MNNNVFAKWWCELNKGDWPAEWPSEKEIFGSVCETLHDRDRRIWPLMVHLEGMAGGLKECLRWWNTKTNWGGCLTDMEFEDFWETQHSPRSG